MAYEFYDILGVAKTASDEEIKRAYRKKAMECHPDRHQGDREKEAMFKRVNEAYSTLSDTNKRARYDQRGTADDANSGMGGGFGGGVEVDLSEIFESFFGGGGGGGRRQQARAERGEDVAAEVPISFTEGILGTKQTISYRRSTLCSECHGTGAKV